MWSHPFLTIMQDLVNNFVQIFFSLKCHMRCTTVYVYTVILNFKKNIFKCKTVCGYIMNIINVGGLLLWKMKLRTSDHTVTLCWSFYRLFTCLIVWNITFESHCPPRESWHEVSEHVCNIVWFCVCNCMWIIYCNVSSKGHAEISSHLFLPTYSLKNLIYQIKSIANFINYLDEFLPAVN